MIFMLDFKQKCLSESSIIWVKKSGFNEVCCLKCKTLRVPQITVIGFTVLLLLKRSNFLAVIKTAGGVFFLNEKEIGPF